MGAAARFDANVAAIRTLKDIETEGRWATPAEQAALAKYSGFGDSAYNAAFEHYYGRESEIWRRRGDELRALTTEDEYKAIKGSRLNAFYTTPEVIQAMWKGLERLGIDKLKAPHVIEPSAGSGRFLGFQPTDLAARSQRTAVELDSLTGRMLRQLYPNTEVYNMGYEAAPLPRDSYDVAISNVPFGNYPIFDPSFKKGRRKLTAQIHNYFFAKTLERLRPGGVLAFVTSHGTLDAPGSKPVRDMLAQEADLVAAVRLPRRAFPDTDVVTDILYMRKRMPGEPQGDTSWTETRKVELENKYGDMVSVPVNAYILDHPQFVLGEHTAKGTMRQGQDEYSLEPIEGADIVRQLDEAMLQLPANVVQDMPPLPPRAIKTDTAVNVREFAHVIDADGVLRVKQGGLLEKVDLNTGDVERVKGMLSIRDAARNVIQLQLVDAPESDITAAQKQLNDSYDSFVAQHGALRNRDNAGLMKTDPDGPFLLALEQAEPGKVEQKEAWQALIRAKTLPIEDGRRLKMPIFTKRTLHGLGDRPVTTIIDAMNVAFNETGRLDFYRMAQLLGKSEDDVITQLAERGEIFKNPEGDWEIASQYLSGEVRDKLRKAEAAASANPRYKPNVEALSRVQPKDLKPSEVSVSLGAPWVGADVVNEFVREILRPWNTYSGRTQYFTYLAQQGQWVTGDELKDVDNTAAKVTWGTPDMPAQKLLLRILNGKLVEVTDEVVDEDGKKKAVRDVKATIAAQEKAQAIENRFKEWVWEDADRADSLLRVYNDTFNGRLPRRYDGSQQVFPGMDDRWAKQISPHQKDAVWRVVQDRTALLAHEVGFGKAESNDAKVLTPFGWKRMGDIQVGDYVVGDDGLPTQVRGVYPQGVRPIFKVTMSDGAATECTDEHLWLTWTYQERTNWGRMPEGKDWECAKPHVRELSEIRRTLKAHKIQAKNHSIPLVEPVAFPTRPLPLDPYLVGVLIGDGHLAADGVSISSADPEIITTVRGLVPVGVTLGDNGGYDHQLTIGRAWAGKPRHGRNPVLEAMREMGLAGCKAAGKFVPDCYKFNDASSRLAILQGLMDTDGTVFKNGLAVSFTSVSQRLAEDVRFLVQSFGGTATIRTRAPTYTYNGGNYGGQLAHEVLIRLPAGIAPFRLSRKAKRVTPFTKYPPVRYITDVQPVGDKPATCILVDNPTHLYVTDDFIVTHNTAVMVTAGMELRRLGLSRKNLYVVPKLTHAQMQRDFTDIYPYADVLFPNDDDFTPAKRQEFASRISTGDWDAVILTYEQFEKLPLKPATEARFIEDEIDSYEAALVALDQEPETDGGYYRRSRVDKAKQKTMKQLEESLKKLRVKLQDVRAKIGDRSDQAIYFEELGIDQIFVDEADNFKSLPFATNMGRIKGLPNSQSQRAWNMYAKTRYLQELGKGHGVVFATGTPVANTIAEMYTMMRYLQQPTLEAKGIQHFDAWAKTFGETVETLEQTPQGTYRMTQRFAKFQNAPELSQLWQDVADIRVADETPEIVKRRPRLVDDNGKNRRTVVAVEPDAALLSYMTGLVERADRMKDVPPEVDNMLKLSSDARKAALDVRMVDPTAPGNPNGKIAVAAKNVARIYRETNADKGTQLIFLDMGTPKAKEVHDDKTVVLDDGDSGEDETAEERALLTNTYAALKDALIEAGVKAEDIAFIHDAKNPRQKVAIQNKVNDGTIRVIIGSTSKMGVGLNIQERAAALHHLDAPWRPRDIEQREGRVIRQKNKVYGPQLDASGKVLDSGKGVRIYSYVTEKSFDGFMWQAIEAKSKAIKAIMRRDNPPRVIDDIDDFTMSAAEAKAIASGDPDVMKRVSLQNAVTRLQMLRASHQDSRLRAREALAKLPGILAEMQSQDAQLTKDADLVSKAPDEFAINIKGQHMTERPDAGEALRQAVASSPVVGDVSQATVAGAYKGFDVKVANLGAAAGYTISLINPATGVAHSIPSIPYSSLTAGVLTRVENRANGLKAESEKVKQAIKQAEADQKGYAAQATTPFEYEDRLQVMESELSRLSRKLQGEQVEDTPSDNYVLPEEEEIKPAYHFGEPERELNSDAEIQAVEAEVEPVEKTLEVKAPPANMEKIIDRLDDPMKGTAAQLSLAGVGPPPQVQMFAETPIGGAEPQAEVGMRPLPGQEPLPVREVAQASQPVSTTETQDPEFADFGKAVKVKTRVAKNKYEWTDGIIQRTLNDGKLYEVKMAGEDGAIRLPSSDVMFAAPKPPAPAAPAAAKEPWQMTFEEFSKTPHNPRDARFIGNQFHHGFVKEALASGKPVPAEVLADYPELAAKAAPAAAKEPWQMTEAELYRGSYGKIPIINELNPSLLREKFADLISDRPGGTAVGLRGIYTPELGKTKLRRSFQSPDGVRDYRLGGTSTLEVAGDWKYEADSVIDKNIQRALKHPHGYGDTPYLAVVEGFRTGEEANDIGEIIIGNARVVAYVRNPTYNHSKAVAAAVSEGKPVPAEVLADYPELAAKAAPAARAEAAKAGWQEQTKGMSIKEQYEYLRQNPELLKQAPIPEPVIPEDPTHRAILARIKHGDFISNAERDYYNTFVDAAERYRQREVFHAQLKRELQRKLDTGRYIDPDALASLKRGDYEPQPFVGPKPLATPPAESIPGPTGAATQAAAPAAQAAMPPAASVDKLWTLRSELTNAYKGQKNGSIYATAKNGTGDVGRLDWEQLGDEVTIAWVEVSEPNRRVGVATDLVRQLREEFPTAKINWGMTTPDGTALRKSVAGQAAAPVSPEPDVVAQLKAGTLRAYHGGPTPVSSSNVGARDFPDSPSWWSIDKSYSEGYAAKPGSKLFEAKLQANNPLDMRNDALDLTQRLPDDLWLKLTRQEQVALRDAENTGMAAWAHQPLLQRIVDKYGYDALIIDEGGVTIVLPKGRAPAVVSPATVAPTGLTKAARAPAIPYSRDLKITNLDAMPKGTGANYLIAIHGEGDVLVAKRWARKMPRALGSGEVAIEMKTATPVSPVSPTQETYADGRLIPKPGDKVFQMVRGAFGMPAYIHGEVNAKGRVVVGASQALIGVGPKKGKTYPVSPHWSVKGDPELERREQARAQAKTDREQQWADEQKAFEGRTAASAQAAIAEGHKPIDLKSLKVGDVIVEHLGGTPERLVVTETNDDGRLYARPESIPGQAGGSLSNNLSAYTVPPPISKPKRKPSKRATKPKTPKKGKRALKAELKTVHEARSARSQAADEAREHSVILDVDDPRVAGWRLHGGRYDVQGVDTPPKRRPQKQTRRTTPRRAAMVTLQERR